jgi:acyl-CoA-binding protein
MLVEETEIKEQSETQKIGFNPLVWLESLFKRLIDGVGGFGGVEAYAIYLSNIDFIPELAPLRQKMKTDSLFFEAALEKCSKEMLKRPEKFRQREIFNLMGATCSKCGVQVSLWEMSSLDGVCSCGGTYNSTYVQALEKLVAKRVLASPEAVLMSVAYERLGNAYVNAYQSLQLVLAKTAEFFNWKQFRIDDPMYRSYMDQYFLGRMAGEQHLAKEEKTVLQLIVRGSLADVTLAVAEPIIRLAIEAEMYGYMYQTFGTAAAYQYYQVALLKYHVLYDDVNGFIRTRLSQDQASKHRHLSIDSAAIEKLRQKAGSAHVPFLLMPRNCWESGKIANDVKMGVLEDFPIFSKGDFGAVQFILAALGNGKTYLLSDIAAYCVRNKQEIIFSPLGDKSNSFATACMPLFAYDKRTSRMQRTLKELGVEPAGIPLLHLTLLRKGEKIGDAERNPPTIFDRVARIDDAKTFKLDFKGLMDDLKGIAEMYGYSKATGMLTVRNLDRFNIADNTNLDIQAVLPLLKQFDEWKKGHPKQSARVQLDELSYVAARQVTLYGSDALKSGAATSDYIKECRRNNTSFDGSTQKPLEVIQDIQDAATNIFFRNLPMNKDVSRSQIDCLLAGLKLKDASVRPVIRDINEKGSLPKGFWFHWNEDARAVEVVNPCPSGFCLQDTLRTQRQLFKRYDKKVNEPQGKQNFLLDSWKDVPEVKVTRDERSGERKLNL